MARGALVALGAVLIVGGGAAIGYAVTRHATGGMTPQKSTAIAAAVGALDGDIKAARATVKERASTLAAIQFVQASVGADSATARDQLTGGELRFDPRPGEVIEIGHVPKGGQPEPLVIQPSGGMRPPHAGQPGSYAELMGPKLVVTEVAPVAVKYNADRFTAYVSVSRPLDLAPVIDKVATSGLTGRFVFGADSVPVGQMAPGAMVHEEPLPSQPDFKLVVAVPPRVGGMPVGVLGAGIGGALVGLVLAIAGALARKQGAPPAAVFATAQTQLGTQPPVAGGTPAPIGASGSAAIGPTNLGAGAMIGRWEIIRRLGSGGMADVFLAHSRGEAGFEKLVAIKVMHPHLARNERAVEHFLDEARLAARISHPNVVQIQDLGKIGDDYVIVMEYVEGVDLDRLLASARFAQRPVPLDVGLAILTRICDGLTAAHRATASDGTPLHVIHRDVKSANVLVSKQGAVKVVDFGIAKAATQSHLTVAGETKGTPSMMAPEQRVGDQVDVRVDVYAVAAVGYEIVTGHAVNLDLAALAHLGVENWPHLPPPSSLRPQLPPELDRILLGAMAFDREHRPADCAVFEATLTQVIKQHGLTASDKDIARWVQAELSALAPPSVATDATAAPSVG